MPVGGGWAGAAANASMAALGFSGMVLPVRFTALGTTGAQEPKRLKSPGFLVPLASLPLCASLALLPATAASPCETLSPLLSRLGLASDKETASCAFRL